MQKVHVSHYLSNSNWDYQKLAIHTYSKLNFIFPMSPVQFRRIHSIEVQSMLT